MAGTLRVPACPHSEKRQVRSGAARCICFAGMRRNFNTTSACRPASSGRRRERTGECSPTASPNAAQRSAARRPPHAASESRSASSTANDRPAAVRSRTHPAPPRESRRPRARRQVVQVDNRPAADIDQHRRPPHLLQQRPAKQLFGFRRLRRGDHHIVAGAGAGRCNTSIPLEFSGPSSGTSAYYRVDAPQRHAERLRPAQNLSAYCPGADPPPASHRTDADAPRSVSLTHPRPGDEVRHHLRVADRRPMPLPEIDMKVPCKAQHHRQRMIGHDIGKQPSHIAEPARMLDQFRKQIMLQTRRRRPAPNAISRPLAITPASSSRRRRRHRRSLRSASSSSMQFATDIYAAADWIADQRWLSTDG